MPALKDLIATLQAKYPEYAAADPIDLATKLMDKFPHYQKQVPAAELKQFQDEPEMFRGQLPKVTMQQQAPKSFNGTQAVAAVDPANPSTINVYRPDLLTPYVQHHELTHSYQLSRDPSVQFNQEQAGHGTYGHLGVNDMQQMQQQGKTAQHLTMEQQANLMADWQDNNEKIAKGGMTQQQAADAYAFNQAAHPFISQMAQWPKQGEANAPIDTSVAAPGLPSPQTPGLGMVAADPLYGQQASRIQ